jgi:hypothetical protein
VRAFFDISIHTKHHKIRSIAVLHNKQVYPKLAAEHFGVDTRSFTCRIDDDVEMKKYARRNCRLHSRRRR